MRIHDAYTKLDRTVGGTNVTKGAGTTGAAGAGKSSGTASTGGTSVSQGVEVAVSSRARELASASDASAVRVSVLRDRIARGEFTIDAKAIAGKLVGADE